jgi:nucleoside-diphosphate-sugar epimerase
LKWLLIGATGQIGYALAHAMARQGRDLTVLVRDKRLAFPSNVKVLQAPAFDASALRQALQGVDAVIYGVGIPEQFAFDTQIFDQINLGIFRSFLTELEATPIRRLVYLSTYEVFEPINGQIRESHPPTALAGMTPYFQAMIKAYALAQSEAQRMGLDLTTIHPAAVYGGRNTGDGITNYLENLIGWRMLQMPANLGGRFPVVHTASLSAAILRALDHSGAFLVSDCMTSMPDMARALRRHMRSYVPLTVPKPMAYASAALFEAGARLTRRRPILAKVQVDFISAGNEPVADKARQVLGFTPLSLDQGLATYLKERSAPI